MVAPRILWRYILRDVVMHTLLGLAVFSILLVAQNVLKLLEDFLAVGVGLGTLGTLLMIALPSYLAYAIPTSLLFGVLLTFSRMSADGEVVAMRAGGISVPRLLPPVVALGVLCAGLTLYLQFEVEPASRYRLKSMVRELARTVDVLEAGKFRKVGQRTVYVSQLGDETCPYRGVLIGDLSEAPRPLYVSAECAGLDPEGTSGLALELVDGSIHFSETDQDRYRLIRFGRMRIALDIESYVHSGKKGRDFTFSELIDLKRQFARGEEPKIRGGEGERTVDAQIHRRLAFPLASLLLGVLGVPLGIRPLRTGRSAGAIIAIGVMAIYWVLFTTGEIAAERGLLPAWLGLWAPNLLVLGLAVLLIRSTVRGDT